jgi:hypothetical protein
MQAIPLLAAGLAVGFGAGWTASRVGAPPDVAPAVAPRASSSASGASVSEVAPARVADLEQAFESEREARVAAEGKKAELEKELAGARAELAAAAGATAAAATSSSGESPRRDAAAIEARVRALGPEVEAALEKKDGKRVLALYAELATLGRPGWPLAAKLGLAFNEMGESQGKDWGVSTMEYYRVLMATDFADLWLDAVEHPGTYEKDFRTFALGCLSMADSSKSIPALVRALSTEKDADAVSAIAGVLGQSPAPEAVSALVTAAASQKNLQARRTIVWALTRTPGDEATNALTLLAASEQDASIKSQLELGLTVRAIPVAGYYIYYVTPQSDGEVAGLKAGDVITVWNGKPLTGWRSLQKTGESQESEQVALSVWREGQTIKLSTRGGTSRVEFGVSGDVTTSR